MENDNESDERLGPILDELLEATRTGKKPNIVDYVTRFPNLAEEIRDLFETLFLVEKTLETPKPESSPLTLERLGDYEIIRQIGRGGMGIVYEAVQLSLDRKVAIKVLPGISNATPELVKRFKREAMAAGHLQHPNIVSVIDVGEAEGHHYFVMQLIRGVGLDEVLQRMNQSSLTVSRFPVEFPLSDSSAVAETCSTDSAENTNANPESQSSITTDSARKYMTSVARLTRDIALALEYAHQNGVLHRDIKPSNLLLDSTDKIWITDFGLAKFGNDELTRSGDVLGTLRFLPPERLRGWSDPRSDIYSLGLTLYEMVTLQPAFQTDDRVEMLRKIEEESPLAPSKFDSKVPLDLETIILTAIAKEPQSRYQSASEFAADLGRYIDGRPILAKRQSAPKKLWLWARRQPVVASLLALAMILLVSIAVISTISATRLNDRYNEVLSANRLADERLLDAYLSEIGALIPSDEPASRVSARKTLKRAVALATSTRQEDLSKLREKAIANFSKLSFRQTKEWSLDSNQFDWIEAGLFNKTVTKVATITDSGGVDIVDLETGTKQSIITDTAISKVYGKVGLSPDGNRLAISMISGDAPGFFQLVNLSNKETVFEKEYENLEFAQFVFAPDGKQIAIREDINDGESRIVIRRLSDGEVIQEFTKDCKVIRMCFSHDSDRLLFSAGYSPDFFIWNLAESKLEFSGQGKKNTASLTMLPESQGIWIANRSGYLEAWKPERESFAKEEVFHVASTKAKQVYMESHAELPWVLSTGVDHLTSLWNANSNERILTIPYRCGAMSPDGTRIGYINQSGSLGYLERMKSPVMVWAYPNQDEMTISMDFSADDSNLIAVANGDHYRMSLFETKTGRLKSSLKSTVGYRTSAQFDPQSKDQIVDIAMGVNAKSRLYEITEESKLKPIETTFPTTEQEGAEIAFDGLGRFVVTCDEGHQLKIRSWPERTEVCKFQLPDLANGHPFRYLTVSANGKWVAAANYMRKHCLVFDIEAQTEVFRPILPKQPFEQFQYRGCISTFSKDSQYFVVTTAEKTRIYATGTWELMKVIPKTQRGLGRVAFSDDYMAISDRDFVELYSVDSFELVTRFQTAHDFKYSSFYSDEVPALTFSPTGRYLASATMKNRIVLWDLEKIRQALQELDLDW